MIEIKATNLVRLKVAFDSKKVEKAYNSALKKTAGKTKAMVSKQVRSIYNIKAKDINQVVRLQPITNGLALLWSGQNLSLARFTPLKRIVRLPKGTPFGSTRRGVSVRIKKSNKRKLVKGGFQVAKLNNQIFQRNDKKMKSDPNKDAIAKMFGISIPQMVTTNVLNQAGDFIGQEMPVQFERAFNFFVGNK